MAQRGRARIISFNAHQDKAEDHVTLTDITLTVQIYNRDSFGKEELLRQTKIIANPTRTVRDLCYVVLDKALHNDMTKGPDQGWGLFVPWDSDTGEARGEVDVEFKAQYLELHRPLSIYDLTSGSVLHYKKRLCAVKVQIFEQRKNVLIDEAWTVAQIVEAIGVTLGLTTSDEYSLKTHDNPEDPEDGWLDSSKTLPEQRVDITADADGDATKLIFKQKLFFRYHSDFDADDSEAMRIMFRQYRSMVLSQQLHVSAYEAAWLGGLALQVMAGDWRASQDYIDADVNYVPPQHAENEDLIGNIYARHKQLRGMSTNGAVIKFVKYCRANKFFGFALWPMEEQQRGGGGTTYVPRMLGLSGKGITRFDSTGQRRVTLDVPWTDVLQANGVMQADRAGIIVDYLDKGRRVHFLALFETEHDVDVILQYIREYLEYVARHELDDEEEEATVSWPDFKPPSQAVVIPGTRPKSKGDSRLVVDIDIVKRKPFRDVNPDTEDMVEQITELVTNPPAPPAPPPSPAPPTETPPDQHDDDVLHQAEQRLLVVDRVAAINVGLANVVLAVGTPDPSVMNPNMLLEAAKALDVSLRDLIGATGDPNTDAPDVSQVSQDTARLLAKAMDLAKAGALGAIDPLAIGDLLASAQDVAGALNNMLGKVGVDAPAEQLVDEIIRLATELHEPIAARFAELMQSAQLHTLPQVTAQQLVALAQTLPDITNAYLTHVKMLVPSVKIPAAQRHLVRRTGVMRKQIDLIALQIPMESQDLYNVGQEMDRIMTRIVQLVGECTDVPEYSEKVETAVNDIRATSQQLNTELAAIADPDAAHPTPAAVRGCVKKVTAAAANLGQLAKLEAGAFSENGSFDSLLAAADDLAAALAKLKGNMDAFEINPDDPDTHAELAQSMAAVVDATDTVAEERLQVALMRALAMIAADVLADLEPLVPAVDDQTESLPSDARAAAESALAAARRSADHLYKAHTIYKATPADLTRQHAFVSTVEAALRDLAPLQSVAHRHAGSEHAELVEAFERDMAMMREYRDNVAVACWPLNVSYALQKIRLAIQRLRTDEDALVAGTYDPPAAPVAARVAQEGIYGAFPAILVEADAVVDRAQHGTGPEIATPAESIATEMDHLVTSVQTLVGLTGSSDAQHAMIGAGVHACEDAADLISKARTAFNKPNDPAQEFILVHARALLTESLEQLGLTVPGVGDCKAGAEQMQAALEGINADAVAPGIGDLLSITQMLADSMHALSGGMADADMGLSAGTIEKIEATADVQHMDAGDIFQSRMGFATHALLMLVSSTLPAKAVVENPDELGAVANKATAIVRGIVDVTQAAATSDELKASKPELMMALRDVVERMGTVFEKTAVLAQVDSPAINTQAVADAESELHAVQIDNAIGAFSHAISAAVNPSDDAKAQDYREAKGLIAAALPTLQPAAIGAPGPTPVHTLQDSLMRAADILANALQRLANTAATQPKKTSKEAVAAAKVAVQAARAAAGLAAHLSDDADADADADPDAAGTSPDAGAGAAGERVASDTMAYEELKDELKKVMTALATLVRTKPTKPKKFKGAYTKVILGVRDLLKENAKVSKHLEKDKAKALKALADKVKSTATKMARQADASKAEPDDQAKHKKFLSYVKLFAQALKKYESAAKRAPIMHTQRASAAASAVIVGGVRSSLLKQTKGLVQATEKLIVAAETVSNHTTNTKAHAKMTKVLGLGKTLAERVRKTTALVTPGQKECEAAIDTAIAVEATLQKAKLAHRAGKTARGSPDEQARERLVLATDQILAVVADMATAAATDADSLLHAALRLSEALHNLAAAVPGATAGLEPQLGLRILTASVEVASQAVNFAHECKNAGGDPRAARRLRPSTDDTTAAINALSNVLNAGANAHIDSEAAQALIADATAVLPPSPEAIPEWAETFDLIPGLRYEDYQRRVKGALINLVKGTSSLVSTAQTAPETLGTEAKRLAVALAPVIDAVAACIALTSEETVRADLLARAQALADAIRALVVGAERVQQGEPVGAVIAASEGMSEQLALLLADVAKGATGKHMFAGAQTSIQDALGDLTAIAFLVDAGQLGDDDATPFAGLVERLTGAAECVTEKAAIALSPDMASEDAMGEFALDMASDVIELIELAELGATSLEAPADQRTLLDAARDLATALAALLDDAHANLDSPDARDPESLPAVNAAAAAFTEAVAHCAEAAARLQRMVDDIAAKIRKVAKVLASGKFKKSDAPNAGLASIQVSLTEMLNAAQHLMFVSQRGSKDAWSKEAKHMPRVYGNLVQTTMAVLADTVTSAAVDDALAELRKVGPCLAQQISQLTTSSEAMAAATQTLVQTLIRALSHLSKARSVQDGVSPEEAFSKEVAQVTMEITATKDRLARLKKLAEDAARTGTRVDVTKDAFLQLMIKACQEITSAAVKLIETAMAAHANAPTQASDDMIVAMRNVAAGTAELASAAEFFFNGETDVSALDRAANSMTAAIREVVHVVSPDDNNDGGLDRAAATVGSACQVLVEAARSFADDSKKAVVADAAPANGPAASSDAASNIREMIRRRAEMEQLQRDIDRMRNTKDRRS